MILLQLRWTCEALFNLKQPVVNLWSTCSKKLASNLLQLASAWIEPHRFNGAAARSLKQFIYITRAFRICINIFLPLIQTSQETFLFEKHLQKWKQVVRFEPLIFMTTFFEIQISHRSRRHSKKFIKPILK